MNKEKIIKVNGVEYKQILLPVRPALKLRNVFTNMSTGEVDAMKMYDEVLANCFDKKYTLEDFEDIPTVDRLVQSAIQNQFTINTKK